MRFLFSLIHLIMRTRHYMFNFGMPDNNSRVSAAYDGAFLRMQTQRLHDNFRLAVGNNSRNA